MRTYQYRELRGAEVLIDEQRPVEVSVRVVLKKVRIELEKGGKKDKEALGALLGSRAKWLPGAEAWETKIGEGDAPGIAALVESLEGDGFTVFSEID